MQPYEPEKLPITDLDWIRLIPLAGRANRAVAALGSLLYGLPSADILLAPMTTQEAVLSSRIEGTRAGLEEVLRFEAGDDVQEEAQLQDIQEILNYRRALWHAQTLLEAKPFCLNTLLELHSILLDSVRGFNKGRGRFRTIQNWIGRINSTLDDALFVPPSPEILQQHIGRWEAYYHADDLDPLVQLAIVHAQFELLHPFLDGNGRIGRMLVPLFLFEKGLLDRPCYYVSGFLEAHRETYIKRLGSLAQPGFWTDWVEFFLTAIAVQGESDTVKARAILDLYERLKKKVIELTRSQYAVPLLDFMFHHPVFGGAQLFHEPNMPTRATINGMLEKLQSAGIIEVVREASGRRSKLFALPELISLCEGRAVFYDH